VLLRVNAYLLQELLSKTFTKQIRINNNKIALHKRHCLAFSPLAFCYLPVISSHDRSGNGATIVRADRKEVSVNYCAIVTINHCNTRKSQTLNFLKLENITKY